MKRVLIAADVDASFVDRMTSDPRFDVVYSPVDSTEDLAALVGTAHVLVTRHHNKVTSAVIESGRALEVIAQGTSGIDNIDEVTAVRRGIKVISVPGENANAVAELVIGFMITLTRTVGTYGAEIRNGQWRRDDCATRRELRGHKLGIVGLGRVGSRVAALARLFGMPVAAYDPYLSADEISVRGGEKVEKLVELLDWADILTLHVPLTAETRKMIDEGQLRFMRAGSFVINASRGEVIDQKALFAALQRGHLAGAALDVFETEPPDFASLPQSPSLIMTPHIAGCTREAKDAIGRVLYERICKHYGLESASDRPVSRDG